MKLTRHGVFRHYDENDLDFTIMIWLYNKGLDRPYADQFYYKLAEGVSRQNGLLPQPKDERWEPR